MSAREQGLLEMLAQRWRADHCTCGMDEQERTGHMPEHQEWCEAVDDGDDA